MATDKIYSRDAARKLSEARRMLDSARGLLSEAHRSRFAPPYAFSGRWHQANAALEAQRSMLQKIPGVVGHGLGFRLKDGVETDEPCVVVFVRDKKPPAELKRRHKRSIPPHLSHGRLRIHTDVIDIGKPKKQLGPLGSLGPMGSGSFGSIGAIVTDLDTGRPAVITAMHVSRHAEVSSIDPPIPFAEPGAGGNRVGQLVLGTSIGIDAGKVLLDPGETVPKPLPLAGVRPISNEANTVVHIFGAVSKMQSGVVKYLNVNLPEINLVNTTLVSMTTERGDSGSGLVDNSGFLVGFLFGLAPSRIRGNLRVFCPAELVMSTLRCSL